jgi:hypothetical protein
VRRQHFEPAHQHVEQALARRLLRHVVIAAAGEHGTVDGLHVRGEDGERRAERVAQARERDAGILGDLGKTDLLDRLFGEQRHERVDDAFALGLAAARGGPCGRFRRWFARHDRTPERIAPLETM